MKKFEYKTFQAKEEGFWGSTLNTEKIELYLNRLGSEGWELVSVLETNHGHGSTNQIVFLLKREMQNS